MCCSRRARSRPLLELRGYCTIFNCSAVAIPYINQSTHNAEQQGDHCRTALPHTCAWRVRVLHTLRGSRRARAGRDFAYDAKSSLWNGMRTSRKVMERVLARYSSRHLSPDRGWRTPPTRLCTSERCTASKRRSSQTLGHLLQASHPLVISLGGDTYECRTAAVFERWPEAISRAKVQLAHLRDRMQSTQGRGALLGL